MKAKWEVALFKEYTCHVVPAEPGFWYGQLIKEAADSMRVVDVVWSPIIAWKIYVKKDDVSTHMTDPVTATDDESCLNDHVIKMPNGEVDLPFDRRFPDWEAALAHLNSTE